MSAKKPWSLFCPYCNAKGIPQPALSPMVVEHVRVPPVDAAASSPAPYYHYQCQRCGFSEIHDVKAADAA